MVRQVLEQCDGQNMSWAVMTPEKVWSQGAPSLRGDLAKVARLVNS